VRATALPLLAVVVLGGCGGSSALSDKDYRAKADAICASIRAQRDRLPPPSNDIEDLRAAARSTIAINTDALRRFKELEPPGDLKAPHAEIVGRLGDTLRLQQQALRAGADNQALQVINVRAAQARDGLLKAAQQAKLQACERL
jgi:hypothetical protein